jgi:hypothetical protein
VAKLLNVSHREASRIVGVRRVDTTKLEQLAAKLSPEAPERDFEEAEGSLEYPEDFVRLKPSGLGRAAWNYLCDERGYGPHVEALVKRFDLQYAIKGRWARRIIIPVYSEGVLVTWTARTIDATDELRYMSLSHDREKAEERGDPVALDSIKSTLYNYDRAVYGGGTLLICEGPFDAMWVDLHGAKLGAVATCLYTTNATPTQLELLRSLRPKFRKFVLLLDKGTLQQTLELRSQLSDLNLVTAEIPEGYKDPGEMPANIITERLLTVWGK